MIFPYLSNHKSADWAGGPGDSKDDVKWLDEQLSSFFQKDGGSNNGEKRELPIRSV